MNRLLSDCAQVEISNRVKEILAAYGISDWQSEPYHQHQNFAENRYETVKRYANQVMDWFRTLSESWLMALKYVVYILNRLSHENLDFKMLSNFPSKSSMKQSRLAGFAENAGKIMCCKIFTADTMEEIPRSRVVSAAEDFKLTLTESSDYDLEIRAPSPIIKSLSEDQKLKLKELFGTMDQDGIEPSELIERSYLQPEANQDGTRHHCKVVQALKEHEEQLGDSKDHQRFLVSMNDREYKKS